MRLLEWPIPALPTPQGHILHILLWPSLSVCAGAPATKCCKSSTRLNTRLTSAPCAARTHPPALRALEEHCHTPCAVNPIRSTPACGRARAVPLARCAVRTKAERSYYEHGIERLGRGPCCTLQEEMSLTRSELERAMTQLSTTAINLSDESMQLTVSGRRRLPLDASALRRLADRAAAANTVAARVRAGCSTSGLLPGPRSGPCVTAADRLRQSVSAPSRAAARMCVLECLRCQRSASLPAGRAGRGGRASGKTEAAGTGRRAEVHFCAALGTGARLKSVMHSYESESMSLGDLSS